MSGQKSRGQTNAAMQILARIKRQRTHVPPDQATSRPGDRSTCPSVLVAFFGQHVMQRQPQSHFTGSDVCGQMKGRTNGRAQFRQRQTEMNMPSSSPSDTVPSGPTYSWSYHTIDIVLVNLEERIPAKCARKRSRRDPYELKEFDIKLKLSFFLYNI